MEADKNTNWIGGSKIDGSLRGKLSPHGATIAAYLAEPEWTTESVRFWNAYMSALRDSPDEQMRIAWADAVSKLGDAASPQAGDPVSETVRAVWQDEMAPADTASWWQPNMVLVDYPWLFRATNAVLLKDFGIHAQRPVNAAGDPLIGVAEEVLGNLLDSYLRAHSVTPFGSTLGRVAGVIGLPLLNVFYEADRSDNPEFFLPADPSDPNKRYRANMWYDPTNKEKPWVLGADITLYVQPHLEYRWGPAFVGHAHGVPVPLSASTKGVHNRVTYHGVDAQGRPGREVIARGTRMTNWEAQFFEQMTRFGAAVIHTAGKPANDVDIAFGAYATEPPWRLVTTPWRYNRGRSEIGPRVVPREPTRPPAGPSSAAGSRYTASAGPPRPGLRGRCRLRCGSPRGTHVAEVLAERIGSCSLWQRYGAD
jgi:hypothetical protein